MISVLDDYDPFSTYPRDLIWHYLEVSKNCYSVLEESSWVTNVIGMG